jgi:hypothetical protein
MEVNIHNQCSNFKLTEGECFSGGADWNKCPGRKVKPGNVMSADSVPFLAVFGGVLIYELQGKHVVPSNRLGSTRTLLLVAWKSEGYKKFRVLVHFIECNVRPYWFNFKPEEYYQRYAGQFSTYAGFIEDTWLTSDGVVIMIRLELDFTQRDGVLNITISESVKDEHTKRPEWINLNR